MELNENYASILNYATGFEYDIKSIKMVGERVYNLERLINVKLGMMRCDDTLPNRFVRWRKKFENALSSYYKLRGWSENGIPKKSKLKTLSIV
jgi:aldehyde:ferredoxin oxidoreductase